MGIEVSASLSVNGSEIYDLLYCLGITAKYAGFFHASYAVLLAVEQPDRLLLVTKWLYPDVAKHYGTNWKAVERNIRTIVGVAWSLRPEVLERFALHTLDRKPRAAQFLAILTAYLRRDTVA